MFSDVAKDICAIVFLLILRHLPLSRSSSSLAFARDIMFRIKFYMFTIGEIIGLLVRMSRKACMAKNAPILFATIVTDLRLLGWT